MEIPYAIKRKSNWFLKHFPGAKIVHLGQYNGEEVFYVQMPDDTITGYPPVFILREGKAVEIIGEESLQILSNLLEEE